jgi:hypothetical protein
VTFRHFSLTLAACLCLGSGWALAADKPLLQDGKKTLFQRVLTTPGCHLSTAAGGPAGTAQPAFSRFYVYERASAGAAQWLKVGPDSFGKTSGWLPADCTVDWKMQLTLAFTNPANRDRLSAKRSKASSTHQIRSAELPRFAPSSSKTPRRPEYWLKSRNTLSICRSSSTCSPYSVARK